jgi:hypothetical protein
MGSTIFTIAGPGQGFFGFLFFTLSGRKSETTNLCLRREKNTKFLKTITIQTGLTG